MNFRLIHQHPSPIKSNAILGWDVGGANLKAALVSGEGVVIDVFQVACPLWRGLEELDRALKLIIQSIKISPQRHVVTMTAELVDIFPSRHEGVVQLSQFMNDHLDGEISFYSIKKSFVPISLVSSLYQSVASANWHASASLIARDLQQGVFVDIGSTTSDLILMKDFLVKAKGLTDAERMAHGELLYTGVVRTPLMSLCQKIKFNGHMVNIAAEHFATTADVYRLTHELAFEDDMADTADGAGKTELESARRLARMVGHDAEDADIEVWRALAFEFREMQLIRLEFELRSRLSQEALAVDAPFIGAGAGRFLVRILAERINKPYLDVESLMLSDESVRHWVNVCFPAVAVAKLALDL